MSAHKMKIGLIDFDGKIPNLALMKISTYFKSIGCEVILNEFDTADKVFCSVLFTWNKEKAAKLSMKYRDITFGGTGWDIKTSLPAEVERCKPDYTLYTPEFLYKRIRGIMTVKSRISKSHQLANMGLGFTTRGCINQCPFCFVPPKEGKLRQVAEIKDIINPQSNIITLLDNNFTADPFMLEKCQEIRERDLIVNFSQGVDVRVLTDEKASALASLKHLRSIHYAWDQPCHEKSVLDGIALLTKHIKAYKHMCYLLVGYNTSFEEDFYRFYRLVDLGILPFIMLYNKRQDNIKLKHFARFVNSKIFKVCSFNEYIPWIKAKQEGIQLTLNLS